MRVVMFLVAVIGVGMILAAGGVGVALALENQDPFCAACHTQPEVRYYEQSQAAQPTTLASYHTHKQTACIDCHSGGGILGRSKGLSQGAHDLLSYIGGAYHRPAVTTNPLSDDSCVKCHTDILARSDRRGSRATNGHYHSFLARWQSLDPKAANCTTCHTAHQNGVASLQFMAQGRVGQVCEDCHTALSGRESDEDTK